MIYHNLIWSQDCADEECKSNKNDLILLLLIIESKMPGSTLDPKSILPMMITSRDGNNFELIFFQIIIAEQHRKCLLQQSGIQGNTYHSFDPEKNHAQDRENMATKMTEPNVSPHQVFQIITPFLGYFLRRDKIQRIVWV